MKQLERYVIKEGKQLRCGYTTGSCATAATVGALKSLLGIKQEDVVQIDTPKGIVLEIEIEQLVKENGFAVCSVKKDAGDDPDVTDGIEIYSKIKFRDDGVLNIYGGIGIGKITVEGFWGKVGDWAINSTPRSMIESEVRKLTDRGLDIEISAPKGAEISQKTYNRNIGIEGGISIIGTSGIVEPMSEDALKKSIYLELDSIKGRGEDIVLLYPGNYGERVAEKLYPGISGVKISNYIGDALLYSYNIGFRKFRLVGHIGKFSKLAVGAFNTHSKICDMRIESFIYYLALRGEFREIEKIKSFVTTEEAVKQLVETKAFIFKDMERGCVERIVRYLKDEDIDLQVKIYSMEYGVL